MTSLTEIRRVPANDGYVICHHDKNPSWLKIHVIEESYKAKYVGEFTLGTKDGGWANIPVSVFYTEKAHPQGSNWFGVYLSPDTGKTLITNAKKAEENTWVGVCNPDTKEILYSAYRHDMQRLGDLFADGGPDYMRSSSNNYKSFKISKDALVVMEE